MDTGTQKMCASYHLRIAYDYYVSLSQRLDMYNISQIAVGYYC